VGRQASGTTTLSAGEQLKQAAELPTLQHFTHLNVDSGCPDRALMAATMICFADTCRSKALMITKPPLVNAVCAKSLIRFHLEPTPQKSKLKPVLQALTSCFRGFRC
jgi:hypothetical protein